VGSAVLSSLLPAEVAAVEVFDDLEDAVLLPGEEAAVERAVEVRRREFTTARQCAREALTQLGMPAVAIPVGGNGEPVWPAGVSGSVTHCAGYRAAVAARAEAIAAIGIDAEPNAPLASDVLSMISRPAECDMLAALPPGGACWDRLLFSIKEAVYKAWFPLAHRWLGFDEAEVAIEPESHSFTAALLVSGPIVAGSELREVTGRWTVRHDLVVSAVSVPSPISGE
jgi:4'-phosphopantetheinyl transferase EntD